MASIKHGPSEKPYSKNSSKGVLIAAAIVLIIIAAIILVNRFAFSPQLSEEEQAEQAALTTLNDAFNPSPEKRNLTVENFESMFETTAGVSFAELGISSSDFASWLFDTVSFDITGLRFNNNGADRSAEATVEVTTHSLTDMEERLTALSNELDAGAFAETSTEEDLYRMIGGLVQQAMDETPLTTKKLVLPLVKLDGSWQVDKSDAANFVTEAFTATA